MFSSDSLALTAVPWQCAQAANHAAKLPRTFRAVWQSSRHAVSSWRWQVCLQVRQLDALVFSQASVLSRSSTLRMLPRVSAIPALSTIGNSIRAGELQSGTSKKLEVRAFAAAARVHRSSEARAAATTVAAFATTNRVRIASRHLALLCRLSNQQPRHAKSVRTHLPSSPSLGRSDCRLATSLRYLLAARSLLRSADVLVAMICCALLTRDVNFRDVNLRRCELDEILELV